MRSATLRTVIVALTAATAVAGCSFTAAQQAEIPKLERQAADLGHPEIKLTQQYSPGRVAGLGFLPFGIAGFYVGRPGLGVSGFLWPISIIWLPQVAANEAQFKNYSKLKNEVTQLREDALNRMLMEKQSGSPPGGSIAPSP